MQAWPAGLPFFTATPGSTRSAPQNALIRTSMDVGPDKVRRRTSAAVEIRQGRIAHITQSQMLQFLTFYKVNLSFGALSFTAFDAFDNETHEFRFLDYSIREYSAGYEISATLEILP